VDDAYPLFVQTIKSARRLFALFFRNERAASFFRAKKVPVRYSRNIACDRRDSVIRGSSKIPNAGGIILRVSRVALAMEETRGRAINAIAK